MKILVADDELAIRSLVAELLTDEGHEVTMAEDGQVALNKFELEWHEIVLSDIRMPNLTGIELLRKVKEISEATQFIIMTSHASVDNSIAALKQGAFDYILKPFEDLDTVVDAVNRAATNLSQIRQQQYLLNTLSRQNEELGDLNKKFREMAIRDGLTGLFNHRYASDLLHEEFDRATRFGRDLSVIFVDLDHFKIYNDTHGHQAGDTVLRDLGQIMINAINEPITAGRWGGEEFIIIAPETGAKSACILAERLRHAVARHPFPNADEQPMGHVSLSIGVATISDNLASCEELLNMADTALYRAKDEGRNRTILSHGDGELLEIRSEAR